MSSPGSNDALPALPARLWQHRTVVAAPPPSSRDQAPPTGPGVEAEPSHFRLFGIPVRIGLGFWLMSFVFGFRSDRPFAAGVRAALAWTAIVFVSILLHELGHALAARKFGSKASITLHAFGGLTKHHVLSRGASAVVSLAGPLTGFAFGAIVWWVSRKFTLVGQQKWLVDQLLWVNIGWGVINLLPVIPLDGGHVLAAALGPRRLFATWTVSAVAAIGIAYLGFKVQSPFIIVLFGFAAVHAIGQARLARAGSNDLREGLDEQLKKARAALDRGDTDDAWLLADDVLRRARSQALKNGALTALAWVHVQRGEGQRARLALSKLEPQGAVDPYTVAAVEDAAGDADSAQRILEEARAQGFRTPDAAKLLIDLNARRGRIERAIEVAQEDAPILGADDLHAVYAAAIESGASRGAARIAARAFELHGRATDALDEARALVAAGDIGAALAALAHALAVGPVDRDAVRADPAFAPIAADERFVQLVGEV